MNYWHNNVTFRYHDYEVVAPIIYFQDSTPVQVWNDNKKEEFEYEQYPENNAPLIDLTGETDEWLEESEPNKTSKPIKQ